LDVFPRTDIATKPTVAGGGEPSVVYVASLNSGVGADLIRGARDPPR